jgi:hypothetical protein
MKLTYNILPAVFLALCACSPAGRMQVTNVNDSGFEQPGRMLYALPQTVLDINADADEIQIIPGPYRQYAEKYLGIHDAPAKPESRWLLKQVTLSQHIESDPDYTFAIKGTRIPEAFPAFEKLIKDSMVIDLGAYRSSWVAASDVPRLMTEPYFTDLSMKRNFEAEKNVEVSLAMPDSGTAVRSSGKKTLQEKTLEQKAEEAANFLIKLKKRRFRMASGMNDTMPQGEAMADALKELSSLEEAYLALFIGKRTTLHHHRTFHYTPAAGKKNDRVVVFRFSDSQGFLEPSENGGKPVQIDLVSGGKTRSFEQSGSISHLSDNMIVYRIPDQVVVRLLFGETVITHGSFSVFQSGALVRMELEPVK